MPSLASLDLAQNGAQTVGKEAMPWNGA